MFRGKSNIQETHYEILSVKENATYEEIRACYRSAILNTHPDKLQNSCETSYSDNKSEDRFLKIQKAWEILNNHRSRMLYDFELRASRQDTVVAEDVSLEDMMVEDEGDDVIEFFYQCRCGDYFSVDSLEVGKMGYDLLRKGSNICVKMGDAQPASVVLSCGSCSLKVRLFINKDVCVSINDKNV
ncbi:hypothetical protein UlMin_022518 [Ulmus minor]